MRGITYRTCFVILSLFNTEIHNYFQITVDSLLDQLIILLYMRITKRYTHARQLAKRIDGYL